MYKQLSYIFDLDGTLALTHHRQHILDNKDNPNRWSEFFSACVYDEPNWPVIETFRFLNRHSFGVQIWSGRSEDVRKQTLEWLYNFVCMDEKRMDNILKMRPSGDFIPDEILKEQWLNNLGSAKSDIIAVFDDRQKVVDMWRKNGIACFQVAPGDF